MNNFICFDLWNTLVRSCSGGGASYVDVLIKLGADIELIYPIVREKLMVSKLSYQQMTMHLCEQLNLSPTRDDLQEAVNNWQRDNEESEWIPDAFQLLDELRRQNNTLILVTNITWPAWMVVDKKLGISRHFDSVFLSCCEGLSKPNQLVWQIIEKRFFHSVSSTRWMIGDNEVDDLAIPRIMNWKTILVGGNGTSLAEIPRVIQEEEK